MVDRRLFLIQIAVTAAVIILLPLNLFAQAPDTTAPVIIGLTPASGDSGLVLDTDLYLSFSEPIFPGTGTVGIYQYPDTTQVEFIYITPDSTYRLHFDDSSGVTISRYTLLDPGTTYYVLIDAGTFVDSAGNPFAGFTDPWDWIFTTVGDTGGQDSVPPYVVDLYPPTFSNDIPRDADLQIHFSEPVVRGAGEVAIWRLPDHLMVETYSLADDSSWVSVNGEWVIVDRQTQLEPFTSYYITIDSTAISDTAGNFFPGFFDEHGWAFETAGLPDSNEHVHEVPLEYPEIQQALYAAQPGDTVLVHPGTYFENLSMYQESIVLVSLFAITGDSSYITQTILDGNNSGSVLTFSCNDTSTISGFTIQNGNASNFGGGISSAWNSGILKVNNCIIRENFAGQEGGGIWVWGEGAWIEVINSVIVKNRSGNAGGGLFANGGARIDVVHSTIVSNAGVTTYNSGGGITNWGSNVEVTNSILWANVPDQILNNGERTTVIRYSDIDGGWGGEGNINSFPYFVNVAVGDHRLADHSPCIGAGTSLGAPGADMDGNPRPVPAGSNPDLGAYENSLAFPAVRPVGHNKYYVSTTGSDDTGDGSEAAPFETIQYAISLCIDGDTVMVLPGIYTELVNYLGKNITLASKYLYTHDRQDIEGTILDGNQAGTVVTMDGGLDSTTVLAGFTIRNGRSSSVAGGVYIHNSSPIITDCIVIHNEGNDGGGIYAFGDDDPDKYYYPVIKNCFVADNSSTWGAGIECWKWINAKIINCVVVRNSVSEYGGGIVLVEGSDALVINCTILNNHATNFGGGIGNATSHPTVKNSIIWGNTATSNVGPQIHDRYGATTISHTNMQDWGKNDNIPDPGDAGNFSVSPLFVDVSNDDYRLSDNSYCIGAGTLLDAPVSDILGNSRPDPAGSQPDLGAYENPLGEHKPIGRFDFLTAGPVEGGVSITTDGAMYAPASGDRVYRFDENGQIIYTLNVNGDIRSATTITADHTVYIASTDNNLYSFNVNGVSNQNWPLSLGSEATASVAVDGISNIYIGTQNGIFQAVSAAGQVLWSYNVGGPVYASAVISEGNTLYIANTNGRILAFDLNTLDPANVQAKWYLDTEATITASPALDQYGYIYITTKSGQLIKIADQGSTGSVVWTYPTGSVIESSPVISANDYVIFGADDGFIYAIDGNTGQLVWNAATDGPVKSTAALYEIGEANDRLYIGSDDGNLYVLNLNNGSLVESYDTGSSIRSPLTYAAGTIYFGTMDGRVFAIQDSLPGLSKTTNSNNTISQWATFQGNNNRTGYQGDLNLGTLPHAQLPENFALHQNFPNPFNPATTLKFDLPRAMPVRLVIFNILGHEIAHLVDDTLEPGYHQAVWSGKTAEGREVPSGIYLARLITPEYTKVIKMLLLK